MVGKSSKKSKEAKNYNHAEDHPQRSDSSLAPEMQWDENPEKADHHYRLWAQRIIAMTIVYGIALKISVEAASLPQEITAVWLPSAINLIALIRWGTTAIFGIAIASGISISIQLKGLIPEEPLISFLLILITNVINESLQGYLLYFMIGRTIGWEKFSFLKLESILKFTLYSFVASAIPAILPILSYCSLGLIAWNQFFLTWLMYIIGASMAQILFVPPFILGKTVPWNKSNILSLEGISLIVFLIGLSYVVFFKSYSLEYIFLPIIIWSVLRLGQPMTQIIVASISFTGIICTAQGYGTFVRESPHESLFFLESFIGIYAITALIFSGILEDKYIADKEVRNALSIVEEKVKEQTQALELRNKEAIELAKKAEAANHAKSAFVANMSHELRTPLNSIIGFSQVIVRRSDVPPRIKGYVENIYRSGHFLLSLINDILDVAKIEADKYILNATEFYLDSLIEDLNLLFRFNAEVKGLQLIFQVFPNIDQPLYGDQTKIKQILTNLINNAIKFTNEGLIQVSFSKDSYAPECSSGEFYLHITVEDTGQGIDASEMSNIFDAFTQTQTGRDSAQGTGLGLYLVKKFVELMDGNIEVSSMRDKGTTFNLTIKIKHISSDSTSKSYIELLDNEEVDALAGHGFTTSQYRILIVDDNALNRQVLREMLLDDAFEVKEASNGNDAIDLFIQWQPAMIFMDIQMSPMDGEETCQRIKSLPSGKATVIIAVTASPSTELKTRLLANNFVAVIEKPFRDKQIFAALNLYLGCSFSI